MILVNEKKKIMRLLGLHPFWKAPSTGMDHRMCKVHLIYCAKYTLYGTESQVWAKHDHVGTHIQLSIFCHRLNKYGCVREDY